MSFLDELTTEQPNPVSQGIDTESTREILETINAEDRNVPVAVSAALDTMVQVVDAAVAGFRRGGRLLHAGAGTSRVRSSGPVRRAWLDRRGGGRG